MEQSAYHLARVGEERRRDRTQMETSSKSFLKYIKSKMRIKMLVGPFVTKEGVLIEEKPRNT